MIGIIGSTNIDIVLEVNHFTIPGETQKAESLNYYFGGKGANQALTVSKLFEDEIYFCTCIGNDSFGKDIAENFMNNKITGFNIIEGMETGKAYIEVNKDRENRIVINDGANSKIDIQIIKEFLNKYSDNFKYVLIQNEISSVSVDFAIKELKKMKKIIIYDPAPKEITNIENLRDIDYLTPNETEFEFLYGKVISRPEKELSIEHRAIKFKNHSGIKNLILKLGSKEIIFIDEKNKIKILPGYSVKMFESTAAGDIFNGAFAVSLANTENTNSSLEFANMSAVVSVTKKVAQTSIPNKDEIVNFKKIHSLDETR